jgi:hypothetical protein
MFALVYAWDSSRTRKEGRSRLLSFVLRFGLCIPFLACMAFCEFDLIDLKLSFGLMVLLAILYCLVGLFVYRKLRSNGNLQP